MSYKLGQRGQMARPFFIKTDEGYVLGGNVFRIAADGHKDTTVYYNDHDGNTYANVKAPLAEVRRAFEERGAEFVDFPLPPPDPKKPRPVF